MSVKPIDEFLKECNVWLEKIAAAKAREEAALRETDAAQFEKKAFKLLARLAGKGLSRVGKGINRAGNRMQRWGKVAPKNTSPQNPLAKQVAAAHQADRLGVNAPKLARGTDGKYVLQQPTAPAPTKVQAGKPAQASAPTPQAPAPANPAPQSVKATTKKPNSNTGDTSTPNSNTAPAPEQPAPASAAIAAPTLWTKAKPWAYVGGGFLAGRLIGEGEQPQQIDPAHVHNMAVLQEMGLNPNYA